MANAAQHIRRHIRFQGRVQGVGFRYTAQKIAARRSLSGYVENLSDGTVRLVVEGEAAEVDIFLHELNEGMGRYIEQQITEEQPATGEFKDFSVRR